MIKPDVVLYEESLDENMIDKSMLTGSAAKRIDGSYMCVFWKKGKMHIIITKIIISR